MKKITGFLFLLILFCSCSAQTYKIKKARAFITESAPGTIMSDDNGNPIGPRLILERSIYIECNYKGKPQIDSVFYNGILFIANVADEETGSITVGKKRYSGQPVRIVPKKGNHIWKIDLQQSSGDELTFGKVKKIVIKGRLGKTGFRYTLTRETELATQPRY